jgi:hypothetical protein
MKTEGLAIKPRNTGEEQVKEPGKMRMKEKGKKKKHGDWRTKWEG